MTFDLMVNQIKNLSIEERKQLITLLVDSLTETPTPRKKRSILEFEGAGKHARLDIDAQEYINQLRSEWDDRP